MTSEPPEYWTNLFSLTIHAMYRSVQEADPWPGCLALMASYFQAANASIVLRPCVAGDPAYLACVPGGGDAMERKGYAADPFTDLPPERVMLVSDLMTDAQWQGSAFFRHCVEHALPAAASHVMGVAIATHAGAAICLRLHRGQQLPPFTVDDKRRLAMFVPHIKQAMRLAADLNCNESQRQIYEEGLERLNIAVIVLDEAFHVLRASPGGRQMLDRGDGLRLVDGQLAAATVAETRELQRLLASARAHPQRVTAMCLSRPSGRRKLAAVVRGIARRKQSQARARPAVAIFLRDPDTQLAPAHDIARQLFDFTPAEAQLAIELLNGLSLDEAVGKLGILRNTGRAHLRAIFSKTGVSRQSELVRVMLNGPLALSALEK